MSKLSISKLKTHLSKLSAEELREEILILFNYQSVREFYTEQLSDDRSLFEHYKKKIHLEYFPARGLGKRKNSHVRALISAFKKVSDSKIDLLELNLWRVEQALLFLEQNGLQAATFYSPVYTSFEDALKLILRHNLMDKYHHRIDNILNVEEDLPMRLDGMFSKIHSKWTED